jgi:orotate phosphoribosyltransferase
MPNTQHDFIEFMVRSQVLTFGDFIAKSGRKTPYFINAGRYRTGQQLRALGEYYARTIEQSGIEFDVLFGPAYKGIALVVATAMALAERGRDVPFCFNRKEVKDHGEGGNLVGHIPRDTERVLILEDVTTAGTSIRETVPLLRAAAKVHLAGLIVSVDRMERGTGTGSALSEVSREFNMPALSIVNVEQVMEYLRGREIDGQIVMDEAAYQRMRQYREQYGAR